MRAAPAVSVHGCGGLPWRLVQTALPALAAACLSLWLAQGLLQSAWWALVAALLVAMVCWRLAAPRDRELRFDTVHWWLDGHVGTLDLMLDLDRAVLLRWRAAEPRASRPERHGRTHWLALTAVEISADWHLLRLALHAAPVQAAAAGNAGLRPERMDT